jgi:hypothetical protein
MMLGDLGVCNFFSTATSGCAEVRIFAIQLEKLVEIFSRQSRNNRSRRFASGLSGSLRAFDAALNVPVARLADGKHSAV